MSNLPTKLYLKLDFQKVDRRQLFFDYSALSYGLNQRLSLSQISKRVINLTYFSVRTVNWVRSWHTRIGHSNKRQWTCRTKITRSGMLVVCVICCSERASPIWSHWSIISQMLVELCEWIVRKYPNALGFSHTTKQPSRPWSVSWPAAPFTNLNTSMDK